MEPKTYRRLYVSSAHVIAFFVDSAITQSRKRHWKATHGSGYSILPYFCYNPFCMPRQCSMHAPPLPILHGRTVHGYVRPGKPLPYHMPRCTENGSRSAREIRMGMLCSENGPWVYREGTSIQFAEGSLPKVVRRRLGYFRRFLPLPLHGILHARHSKATLRQR